MKILKTLLTMTVALGSLNAFATEKVLSTRTVTLPVDVSHAKLKFTNAGYGSLFFVKILVPELAGETIMNHRNEGEGAPCLATRETENLEDVLQGRPEIIPSVFKIELIKILLPDSHQNICKVTLRETITTQVRGYNFFHSREQEMPDRALEDCQ